MIITRLNLHIGALIFLCLAVGRTGKQSVHAAKPQLPAAPVIIATVTERSMPVQVQAIGNVEAIATVSIKPQISGELVGVHFNEGDYVKKGQLLFTIDRAPFEAALRQAEATLAKDQAQAENAKIDAERYQGLGRQGVVSKQQVDATAAAYNALNAAVAADKALRVEASAQGTGQHFGGKLTFIDNAVDLTTGTIKLKATFDNQQRALWPGQFVDVSMTLTSQPNAIVIPNAALQTGQNGTYVYVVNSDMTAQAQAVKVGWTVGDSSVITSGLQAGQRIVTDGQLRIIPGGKVEIKNAS